MILSTKLRKSITNKPLTWASPLHHLNASKNPTKTSTSLSEARIHTLEDLVWVLPLRIQTSPTLSSFFDARDEELFRGHGKITAIQKRFSPSRGKRRVTLYNVRITVQDTLSVHTLTLVFFNCYPSIIKSLESSKFVEFLGTAKVKGSQVQILNPKIISKEERPQVEEERSFLIQYPTINKVSGTFVKKYIDKIPPHLWKELASSPHNPNEKLGLGQALKIIHGKLPVEEWEPKSVEEAKKRLIYEEFFREQVKIHFRKSNLKSQPAPVIKKQVIPKDLFDFELTNDQNKVLDQIQNDLAAGRPMMRLLQGDVGCGKTAVAMVASFWVSQSEGQIALMCPTESLALQHFQSFQSFFGKDNGQVDLLLGSTKAAERREILARLESGECKILIGTHSLIQKDIIFQSLQMAIIDEQHKFGVEQRIKLTQKGEGVHTLIMTATPIPRSLSLTQFGDLEISVIREKPKSRAKVQSKIVSPDKLGLFLNFVMTRLSLNEQVYVVVPAIEESPSMDLANVNEVFQKFEKFYPKYKVAAIHGKLKSEEKESLFKEFQQGKINILISTSVIEVGINIPNATVMAILNPERFGLSSLHQLRGRIGRGTKPGFFFMLTQDPNPHAIPERLKVIEKTSDGFLIAEEDLKLRGNGDLFGLAQSGENSGRKLANLVTHQDILENVKRDFDKLAAEQPETLEAHYKHLKSNALVSLTI